MRNIMILLACLSVAPLTACSRAAEYCDTACQCENCSENEYDECVIRYEASEDTADTYGCTDQFARAHDCVMINNDCIADNFAPELECLDDISDVGNCIDGNSAL